MRANNKSFYISYFNKIVGKQNNTYCSIGKQPIDIDYFDLTEEIESSYKSLRFKVDDRVKITNYKNIFSKGYTENWSGKKFVINLLSKFVICTKN